MRLVGTAILAVLVAFAAHPSTAAGETVRFRTATTPPTPLQQRLARERGRPVLEQPSVEIAGELYRPSGNGPFPAVVSLHGCTGREPRGAENVAGARYIALGYALLIADSFGPRGVEERCDEALTPVIDRVMDAYGALLYLAGRPFVDPDRIAVVGHSQGAGVALTAVERGGVEAQFDRHFRAAIAYYPPCPFALAVSVPTLILVGELDDWARAHDCRDMMARRRGEGAPLRLVVYPGAYHAFDAASLRDRPATFFGHRLEYNAAADRAAWDETVRALKQAFGR